MSRSYTSARVSEGLARFPFLICILLIIRALRHRYKMIKQYKRLASIKIQTHPYIDTYCPSLVPNAQYVRDLSVCWQNYNEQAFACLASYVWVINVLDVQKVQLSFANNLLTNGQYTPAFICLIHRLYRVFQSSCSIFKDFLGRSFRAEKY